MKTKRNAKPLLPFDKRQEIAEAEDAKTWNCNDCGLPTEDGQTKCSSCRQYEKDIANGMFNYDYLYEPIDQQDQVDDDPYDDPRYDDWF